MTNALADMARDIAHGLTLRIDQKVAVCIKPKPRFITQNMWLRIAAVFIYIEKTQPSMTMKGETHER